MILISDPKIWAIDVQECHEPLVDVKDLNISISLTRAPFYAGYTKVRETVAQKLLQALAYLPPGFNFLFSEGHRPITLQHEMYQAYAAHLAKLNPTWNAFELRQAVTQYIASPEDVPPHSTGGAIDITLMDANQQEVDMGSPLDALPGENENLNFTHTPLISAAAKTHRQWLIEALSQAGFINYPAEWWHWSYGDKYWAYHTKSPYAIYGSVA